MKPSEFDYLMATTLDEAISLLDQHGDEAEILAGGQSLIPALALRLSAPKILIDINSVADLGDINVSEEGVQIGALVRHTEILESPLIAQHIPLLAQAAQDVAHSAIRNRGTFGGSLVNAHPAAEFPACAIALDAEITLLGPSGTRTIAALDFFTGLFSTVREPNEILVSVMFPATALANRSEFQELSIRQGDFPLVGLAAHCQIDNNRIENLRLVYLGVSDKPTRAYRAEQCFEGQLLNPDTIAKAQEEISNDLDPVGDFNASAEYKMHLAKVLLSRVITSLVGQE